MTTTLPSLPDNQAQDLRCPSSATVRDCIEVAKTARLGGMQMCLGIGQCAFCAGINNCGDNDVIGSGTCGYPHCQVLFPLMHTCDGRVRREDNWYQRNKFHTVCNLI
mmetsp:Transcript_12382/g.14573  ORF Transcript_12382/g.14573 Transcript_12382/m.14573 type:complete len:107 (+) Transcript_12382:336-656(+)